MLLLKNNNKLNKISLNRNKIQLKYIKNKIKQD